MKLTEEIIKSETIYEGRVINLKVNDVMLENGKTAKREIVEHPGGVCVISIDENEEVLMVRQYRAPFETVVLEAPAGKLNYGEDHFECGKREFLEETGYEARDMTYMGEYYPSVGFLNEKIHIYIAENLSKKSQHLDEDEFLNVEKIPLSDLVEMVRKNEIKDAKTVIAIFLLKNYVGDGKWKNQKN